MKFYIIPQTRFLEDLEESVNSGYTPMLLTIRTEIKTRGKTSNNFTIISTNKHVKNGEAI